MNTDQLLQPELIPQLMTLAHEQFSGRVQLRIIDGEVWHLYFTLGRLVWATGGYQVIRRLHRLLNQYCPQIDTRQEVPATAGMRCWDYHFLAILVRRQRITREQVVAVIDHAVKEVLFDLLQQEAIQALEFSTDRQESLDAPLTVISVEIMRQQVQQDWEAWRNAGVAERSPNLAPVIRQPDLLRQQVSASVYETLVSLVDGKRSLRDLSVLMKQDLLLVTRSLLPFVTKGLMGLAELTDPESSATTLAYRVPASQVAATAPKMGTTTAKAPAQSGPLIACIDDSPLVLQAMEKILSLAGYQMLAIQNPLMALTTLLERKPDFIFLDLVMPVANGYEVCSQIRRISQFKTTPVVILTGNDGLVDRVRAKMVGSTDFLPKPVDHERVLASLAKYLQVEKGKSDPTPPDLSPSPKKSASTPLTLHRSIQSPA